ncbi:MAG: hypothetical protein FJ256_04450 [Phycisphaerae bacterium]|nr:hypothetical protein [Phycisphaerae bacterium]
MATPQSLEPDVATIKAAAGPYPIDALRFVQAGFGHAAKSDSAQRGRIEAESLQELDRPEKHMSGQHLCFRLAEFAIEQYGLMAPLVLRRWNIERTDDFGRIVYALIELGYLRKSPDDSIDDFRGVYDFAEIFGDDRLRQFVGGTTN